MHSDVSLPSRYPSIRKTRPRCPRHRPVAMPDDRLQSARSQPLWTAKPAAARAREGGVQTTLAIAGQAAAEPTRESIMAAFNARGNHSCASAASTSPAPGGRRGSPASARPHQSRMSDEGGKNSSPAFVAGNINWNAAPPRS